MNYSKGQWITDGKDTGLFYEWCHVGPAVHDYKVLMGKHRLCTESEITDYIAEFGMPELPQEKELRQNDVSAIYQMLHDFRNWNREWDLYMSSKPDDVDEFVQKLSKKYEVKTKNL